MQIIIGREEGTQLLAVLIDGKKATLNTRVVVPKTVSRQHMKITMNTDGTMLLENIKMQNVTYVNGVEVHSKRVSFNDRVEMGPDRFVLDWNVVKQAMPKVADIRNLKYVWQEYETAKANISKKQQKFNALRSGTGILSMLAIAISVFDASQSGSINIIRMVAYAAAFLLSVVFFIVAYVNAGKSVDQQKELDKKFRKDCACTNPECRHYLGNYGFYDNIPNSCPYCKASFIK